MVWTARSRLALSLVAATAFGTVGGLAPTTAASAHDNPPPSPAGTSGDATYFVAALNGRNEVSGPAGSPAVGDRDGQAVQVLRVKGNQVSFAMKWKGLAAPTAGHIHLGATGTNGAVKVPFFDTPLPDTLTTAVGSVTVTDPALLDSIRSNPGGFYANLHTAEFAGGAVRGQLHKVTHPVDLNSFLRGGPLGGMLDGGQEVEAPGGAPAGDPDGHATSFVRSSRDQVNFSFTWNGIGAPTEGHLHQGATGVNGPIVVALFSAPAGLPASVTGVAGVAGGVTPDVAKKVNQEPSGFYADLRTAEFGGGAVRGQLFRSGGAGAAFDSSSFIASVVKGEQIYACTKQADGTFAFTQHNVSARLQGGIRHSFVKNDVGPPQWIAPDHSSVSGTLLSRTPNGANNIPELDLDLTQTGAATGQLANAVEVERLNTVGGVAPSGACDPRQRPVANVAYQADYLFIIR